MFYFVGIQSQYNFHVTILLKFIVDSPINLLLQLYMKILCYFVLSSKNIQYAILILIHRLNKNVQELQISWKYRHL